MRKKPFFIKAIALALCFTFIATDTIAYSDAAQTSPQLAEMLKQSSNWLSLRAATISGLFRNAAPSVSGTRLPAAAPKFARYLSELRNEANEKPVTADYISAQTIQNQKTNEITPPPQSELRQEKPRFKSRHSFFNHAIQLSRNLFKLSEWKHRILRLSSSFGNLPDDILFLVTTLPILIGILIVDALDNFHDNPKTNARIWFWVVTSSAVWLFSVLTANVVLFRFQKPAKRKLPAKSDQKVQRSELRGHSGVGSYVIGDLEFNKGDPTGFELIKRLIGEVRAGLLTGELQKAGLDQDSISHIFRLASSPSKSAREPIGFKYSEAAGQFELIKNDLRTYLHQLQKTQNHDHEINVYALGLGNLPVEAEEVIKLFLNVMEEELGEAAKNWSFNFIGIDFQDEPIKVARKYFAEDMASLKEKGFRKVTLQAVKANALSSSELTRVFEETGGSKKADYLFHRHVMYVNRASSWLNQLRGLTPITMLRPVLADALESYLQSQNLIGAFTKTGTRYVIEPLASSDPSIREVVIPGSSVLPQENGAAGSGIYIVNDPAVFTATGFIQYLQDQLGENFSISGPLRVDRTGGRGELRRASNFHFVNTVRRVLRREIAQIEKDKWQNWAVGFEPVQDVASHLVRGAKGELWIHLHLTYHGHDKRARFAENGVYDLGLLFRITDRENQLTLDAPMIEPQIGRSDYFAFTRAETVLSSEQAARLVKEGTEFVNSHAGPIRSAMRLAKKKPSSIHNLLGRAVSPRHARGLYNMMTLGHEEKRVIDRTKRRSVTYRFVGSRRSELRQKSELDSAREFVAHAIQTGQLKLDLFDRGREPAKQILQEVLAENQKRKTDHIQEVETARHKIATFESRFKKIRDEIDFDPFKPLAPTEQEKIMEWWADDLYMMEYEIRNYLAEIQSGQHPFSGNELDQVVDALIAAYRWSMDVVAFFEKQKAELLFFRNQETTDSEESADTMAALSGAFSVLADIKSPRGQIPENVFFAIAATKRHKAKEFLLSVLREIGFDKTKSETQKIVRGRALNYLFAHFHSSELAALARQAIENLGREQRFDYDGWAFDSAFMELLPYLGDENVKAYIFNYLKDDFQFGKALEAGNCLEYLLFDLETAEVPGWFKERLQIYSEKNAAAMDDFGITENQEAYLNRIKKLNDFLALKEAGIGLPSYQFSKYVFRPIHSQDEIDTLRKMSGSFPGRRPGWSPWDMTDFVLEDSKTRQIVGGGMISEHDYDTEAHHIHLVALSDQLQGRDRADAFVFILAGMLQSMSPKIKGRKVVWRTWVKDILEKTLALDLAGVDLEPLINQNPDDARSELLSKPESQNPILEINQDWRNIFDDNAKPLVVDVGFGNGETLLYRAQHEPDKNFIGIELPEEPYADMLAERIQTVGIKNLKVLKVADFEAFRTQLKFGNQAIVSELTYYDPFPDSPYVFREHTADLQQILKPGALVKIMVFEHEFWQELSGIFESNGFQTLNPADHVFEDNHDTQDSNEAFSTQLKLIFRWPGLSSNRSELRQDLKIQTILNDIAQSRLISENQPETRSFFNRISDRLKQKSVSQTFFLTGLLLSSYVYILFERWLAAEPVESNAQEIAAAILLLGIISTIFTTIVKRMNKSSTSWRWDVISFSENQIIEDALTFLDPHKHQLNPNVDIIVEKRSHRFKRIAIGFFKESLKNLGAGAMFLLIGGFLAWKIGYGLLDLYKQDLHAAFKVPVYGIFGAGLIVFGFVGMMGFTVLFLSPFIALMQAWDGEFSDKGIEDQRIFVQHQESEDVFYETLVEELNHRFKLRREPLPEFPKTLDGLRLAMILKRYGLPGSEIANRSASGLLRVLRPEGSETADRNALRANGSMEPRARGELRQSEPRKMSRAELASLFRAQLREANFIASIPVLIQHVWNVIAKLAKPLNFQFRELGLTQELLRLQTGFWITRFGPEDRMWWGLRDGMKFGDTVNWWGPKQKRPEPLGFHTGIDFVMYQNFQKAWKTIPEGTEVQALYGGTVVSVFQDDMQSTLVVNQEITDTDGGNTLVTIYAHIEPETNVQPGVKIEAGDVLGRIRRSRNERSIVSPHLHLSIGWAKPEFFERLKSDGVDWPFVDALAKEGLLTYVDPLTFLDKNEADHFFMNAQHNKLKKILILNTQPGAQFFLTRQVIEKQFPGVTTLAVRSFEEAQKILNDPSSEIDAVVRVDESASISFPRKYLKRTAVLDYQEKNKREFLRQLHVVNVIGRLYHEPISRLNIRYRLQRRIRQAGIRTVGQLVDLANLPKKFRKFTTGLSKVPEGLERRLQGSRYKDEIIRAIVSVQPQAILTRSILHRRSLGFFQMAYRLTFGFEYHPETRNFAELILFLNGLSGSVFKELVKQFDVHIQTDLIDILQRVARIAPEAISVNVLEMFIDDEETPKRMRENFNTLADLIHMARNDTKRFKEIFGYQISWHVLLLLLEILYDAVPGEIMWQEWPDLVHTVLNPHNLPRTFGSGGLSGHINAYSAAIQAHWRRLMAEHKGYAKRKDRSELRQAGDRQIFQRAFQGIAFGGYGAGLIAATWQMLTVYPQMLRPSLFVILLTWNFYQIVKLILKQPFVSQEKINQEKYINRQLIITHLPQLGLIKAHMLAPWLEAFMQAPEVGALFLTVSGLLVSKLAFDSYLRNDGRASGRSELRTNDPEEPNAKNPRTSTYETIISNRPQMNPTESNTEQASLFMAPLENVTPDAVRWLDRVFNSRLPKGQYVFVGVVVDRKSKDIQAFQDGVYMIAKFLEVGGAFEEIGLNEIKNKKLRRRITAVGKGSSVRVIEFASVGGGDDYEIPLRRLQGVVEDYYSNEPIVWIPISPEGELSSTLGWKPKNRAFHLTLVHQAPEQEPEARSELRNDGGIILEAGQQIKAVEGYQMQLQENGSVAFYRERLSSPEPDPVEVVKPTMAGMPVYDEAGNIMGYVGITHDFEGQGEDRKLIARTAFYPEPEFDIEKTHVPSTWPAWELLKAVGLLIPKEDAHILKIEDISQTSDSKIHRITVRVPEEQSFPLRGIEILARELIENPSAEQQFDLVYNEKGHLLAVFPVFGNENRAAAEDGLFLDVSPYYFEVPKDIRGESKLLIDQFLREWRQNQQHIQAYQKKHFGSNRMNFWHFSYNNDENNDEDNKEEPLYQFYHLLHSHGHDLSYLGEVEVQSLEHIFYYVSKDPDRKMLLLPIFPTVFPPSGDPQHDTEYHKAILIDPRFDLNENQRTLVVGSGSGFDTWLVSLKTRKTVSVIDINPLAVANTKALAKIAGFKVLARTADNIVDESGKPTFPDARFDRIIWNMPEHVEGDGPSHGQLATQRTKWYLTDHWDGDVDGFSLTRFASGLCDILNPDSRVLIWNSNNEDSILNAFENRGMEVERAGLNYRYSLYFIQPSAAAGELLEPISNSADQRSEPQKHIAVLQRFKHNPTGFMGWLKNEIAEVLTIIDMPSGQFMKLPDAERRKKNQRIENAISMLYGVEDFISAKDAAKIIKNIDEARRMLDEIYQMSEWRKNDFSAIRGGKQDSKLPASTEQAWHARDIFNEFLPKNGLGEALQKYTGDKKVLDTAAEKWLPVFTRVPKHLFMPKYLRQDAYLHDAPYRIGYGQTISQPSLVAFILALLDLEPSDEVLEVGAGSGWLAALMSQQAAHVYATELIPQLAGRAERVIENMGIQNVSIVEADGSVGYPQAAPFDKIVVSAGSPNVPELLVNQLREGGLLIIPVLDPAASKKQKSYKLTLFVKEGGKLTEKLAIDRVNFVDLRGVHGWQPAPKRSELRRAAQPKDSNSEKSTPKPETESDRRIIRAVNYFLKEKRPFNQGDIAKKARVSLQTVTNRKHANPSIARFVDWALEKAPKAEPKSVQALIRAAKQLKKEGKSGVTNSVVADLAGYHPQTVTSISKLYPKVKQAVQGARQSPHAQISPTIQKVVDVIKAAAKKKQVFQNEGQIAQAAEIRPETLSRIKKRRSSYREPFLQLLQYAVSDPDRALEIIKKHFSIHSEQRVSVQASAQDENLRSELRADGAIQDPGMVVTALIGVAAFGILIFGFDSVRERAFKVGSAALKLIRRLFWLWTGVLWISTHLAYAAHRVRPDSQDKIYQATGFDPGDLNYSEFLYPWAIFTVFIYPVAAFGLMRYLNRLVMRRNVLPFETSPSRSIPAHPTTSELDINRKVGTAQPSDQYSKDPLMKGRAELRASGSNPKKKDTSKATDLEKRFKELLEEADRTLEANKQLEDGLDEIHKVLPELPKDIIDGRSELRQSDPIGTASALPGPLAKSELRNFLPNQNPINRLDAKQGSGIGARGNVLEGRSGSNSEFYNYRGEKVLVLPTSTAKGILGLGDFIVVMPRPKPGTQDHILFYNSSGSLLFEAVNVSDYSLVGENMAIKFANGNIQFYDKTGKKLLSSFDHFSNFHPSQIDLQGDLLVFKKSSNEVGFYNSTGSLILRKSKGTDFDSFYVKGSFIVLVKKDNHHVYSGLTGKLIAKTQASVGETAQFDGDFFAVVNWNEFTFYNLQGKKILEKRTGSGDDNFINWSGEGGLLTFDKTHSRTFYDENGKLLAAIQKRVFASRVVNKVLRLEDNADFYEWYDFSPNALSASSKGQKSLDQIFSHNPAMLSRIRDYVKRRYDNPLMSREEPNHDLSSDLDDASNLIQLEKMPTEWIDDLSSLVLTGYNPSDKGARSILKEAAIQLGLIQAPSSQTKEAVPITYNQKALMRILSSGVITEAIRNGQFSFPTTGKRSSLIFLSDDGTNVKRIDETDSAKANVQLEFYLSSDNRTVGVSISVRDDNKASGWRVQHEEPKQLKDLQTSIEPASSKPSLTIVSARKQRTLDELINKVSKFPGWSNPGPSTYSFAHQATQISAFYTGIVPNLQPRWAWHLKVISSGYNLSVVVEDHIQSPGKWITVVKFNNSGSNNSVASQEWGNHLIDIEQNGLKTNIYMTKAYVDSLVKNRIPLKGATIDGVEWEFIPINPKQILPAKSELRTQAEQVSIETLDAALSVEPKAQNRLDAVIHEIRNNSSSAVRSELKVQSEKLVQFLTGGQNRATSLSGTAEAANARSAFVFLPGTTNELGAVFNQITEALAAKSELRAEIIAYVDGPLMARTIREIILGVQGAERVHIVASNEEAVAKAQSLNVAHAHLIGWEGELEAPFVQNLEDSYLKLGIRVVKKNVSDFMSFLGREAARFIQGWKSAVLYAKSA